MPASCVTSVARSCAASAATSPILPYSANTSSSAPAAVACLLFSQCRKIEPAIGWLDGVLCSGNGDDTHALLLFFSQNTMDFVGSAWFTNILPRV
jgi:hypothetical protein